MSYQFNDEDKEAVEFAERMPYGVNKVQLVGVTAGETDAGKDYIEVTVTNADGIEDSGRVWFVGGASKYSFDTLRQIVIHSQKSDSDKEAARMAVEKCVDNEALADLINKQCVGAELWFTKYFDAERTYQGSDGVTRRSVNKNIYGYEPRLKPELMPEAFAKNEDSANPLAGATPEPSETIPDKWA